MVAERIIRLIHGLAKAMALFAGAAVLVLSLLIAFDIVSRDLFRYSLQGTDELGGYALALIGSLGLSYTLLQRGHPRIDIALRHFPAAIRRLLHILAYAALAAFAVFAALHAYEEFAQTVAFGSITNTPLQTPLWVPQLFWVGGTVAFAVTTLALTCHALVLLLQRPQEVDRLYGPLTVEEEVSEYVGDDHASPTRGEV